MKDLNDKELLLSTYRSITKDSYDYSDDEINEICGEIRDVCLADNLNYAIKVIKNWESPSECAMEFRRWYDAGLDAGLRLIECPHCGEEFYD